MYGCGDRSERSGDTRRFLGLRMHCTRRATQLRLDRSAKLLGALRGIARTLPPDVMKTWLGVGGRKAGVLGPSGLEALDATSILILIIVGTQKNPITFREIEGCLPDWARGRQKAMGELLEADLLIIEPIVGDEPALFRASSNGRRVALMEAVHLLLSIG